MKTHNNKKKLIILTIILIFTAVFCYSQNNNLVTTHISFSSEKLPSAFENFVIVQISDLHNKSFGKNQSAIIAEIKKAKPDIIVITGDLIDRKTKKPDNALCLIQGIQSVAPIYFVTGNHEASSKIYIDLLNKLIDSGVIFMDERKVKIEKDNSFIELLGLSDPYFNTSQFKNTDSLYAENYLKDLTDYNNNSFKILLSHRPELIDVYSKFNIDLVFSGHAHGGQIRLPFIGGLFSPNQGIKPKYTAGIYKNNNTSEIVSRGLGNSTFPLRVFNRPELVICTLKSGQA